ncbi:MAG: GntR family transcriptional regulator [Oscillospiraceae bacterium]|nr:GntR family transcriptional regulator [Oscillospiraceae bacterium]MDE7011462.1 GntR family transcriptional regulator [Oscillospiraceae bacterium]
MAKKYETVYNDLREQINRGEFRAEDKLPSETELVDRYAVSRQTVRQALKLLEKDGSICKVRGSGTFVQEVLPRIETKCVAVITYDIAASVFPAVLSRIEQTLFSSGYATMLFSTCGSPQKERQILEQLCANPVNGIILHATESMLNSLNIDLILKLQGMGTRFVFMDNRYPDEALRHIPSVTMDDYQGAHQITSELIASGCRNLGGIFSCMASQLLSRFLGVRRAVVDAGIVYDRHDFLLCGDNDEERVKEQIASVGGQRLFEKESVLCGSGAYAAHLCDVICLRGRGAIRTLVSFDDADLPAIEGIRFIKLKHAGREIGDACARKILHLIQGGEESDESFPWRTEEGKRYPS